jgi:hypothetical protein
MVGRPKNDEKNVVTDQFQIKAAGHALSLTAI